MKKTSSRVRKAATNLERRDSSGTRFDRREFLRMGLAAGAAFPLISLAAACAPSVQPPAGGVAGGGLVTLALASFGDERLDSFGANPSLPYRSPMLDFMVKPGPTGEFNADNGVLEKWEKSGGQAYNLTLKKGIKWHDGVEMTSDDIAYSFETAKDATTQCTSCQVFKANIDKVEIIDKYNVRITLKAPDVTFIYTLGSVEGDMPVMPKHHIQKIGGIQAFADNPLGSGPWRFVSRTVGQDIKFTANKDYWNAKRIPGFSDLRIVLAPDAQARTSMLRTGEADMIQISSTDAATLKSQGFDLRPIKHTNFTWIHFMKSYDPAFLTNKRQFRQAVAAAVDWPAIARTFYSDAATGEIYSGGAPGFNVATAGYDANLKPYAYDVALAKRLLQEVGYTNQQVLFYTFVSPANPEQLSVNEAIAGYLRTAGFNVQLVPLDITAYLQKMVADPQQFDAPAAFGVFATNMRPSAVQNLRTLYGSKAVGGAARFSFDLEMADRLYRETAAIVDDQARNARLKEINKQLYDSYIGVPIALKNVIFASGKRVKGWSPTPNAVFDLAAETLTPAQ